MIEFLRGTLIKKDHGHLLVDVNGVGYGVDVPVTALGVLPEIGKPVELLIYFYLQMSQGATGISLYGFVTEKERELFEVLLSAPGIGPSKAIDIMSSLSADDLAHAVLRGDVVLLGRAKGIGKKTAEKLVVNLRDKMKRYAMLHAVPEATAGRIGTAGVQSDSGMSAVPAGGGSAAVREAVEALEALGVKPLVAERAALKALDVLGGEATVAELIKEGLKHRR